MMTKQNDWRANRGKKTRLEKEKEEASRSKRGCLNVANVTRIRVSGSEVEGYSKAAGG